jgi:hypothetical protein
MYIVVLTLGKKKGAICLSNVNLLGKWCVHNTLVKATLVRWRTQRYWRLLLRDVEGGGVLSMPDLSSIASDNHIDKEQLNEKSRNVYYVVLPV